MAWQASLRALSQEEQSLSQARMSAEDNERALAIVRERAIEQPDTPHTLPRPDPNDDGFSFIWSMANLAHGLPNWGD